MPYVKVTHRFADGGPVTRIMPYEAAVTYAAERARATGYHWTIWHHHSRGWIAHETIDQVPGHHRWSRFR